MTIEFAEVPGAVPPVAAAAGVRAYKAGQRLEMIAWTHPEVLKVEAIEPVELKLLGYTQRDALISLCDEANIWSTPEGETFVTVAVRDHVEHYALYSRAFRDWLLGELARRFLHNGRPASAGDPAVRDARQAIQARGFLEATRHKAPLRIAEHGGAIFIDRGGPDWSAIRVGPNGWSIVGNPPVPIIRSKRTSALAEPTCHGDFAPLMRLLDRLGRQNRILLVSWLLGALSPNGPYPILIIGGEAGSGKTTMVRLAQRLVDPVTGDLLQPPGDDRDLIAAARNGRVLAFDNLSGLRPEMAERYISYISSPVVMCS